jgi:peroxiredoxin Q/BCP
LLCDVDHRVGRTYGVERGPDDDRPDYPKRMTFLIDPDGKIAKVYVVSDAGAHPEVVLEDLRQLVSPA